MVDQAIPGLSELTSTVLSMVDLVVTVPSMVDQTTPVLGMVYQKIIFWTRISLSGILDTAKLPF